VTAIAVIYHPSLIILRAEFIHPSLSWLHLEQSSDQEEEDAEYIRHDKLMERLPATPASESEIKQFIRTIRVSTFAYLQQTPFSGETVVIALLENLCKSIISRMIEPPLPRDIGLLFEVILHAEYKLWEGMYEYNIGY
jgi:hypothetical protein